MDPKRFTLRARVSTDNPTALQPVLERLVPSRPILRDEKTGEFRVETVMDGSSARDLNRTFLSELRRVEKRTRLRAEWTCNGVTERFFDYVAKGKQRA
ncbi:MAG TPA: hypothetical protein VEH28_08340 [Thermoplasmata archaeon]|nr:hypothetical protein [Thermoplasmata archaeon]